MKRMTITAGTRAGFSAELRRGEKSAATVEKYLRYARRFSSELCGAELTKDAVIAYKARVAERYTAAGANGMIAAVNSLLVYLGRADLRVSPLKVQRRLFSPPERELNRGEFERLVAVTERGGDARLSLALRTMFATGIRVGELRFVTVEAARGGRTEIRLKGKIRELFLQPKLCKLLLGYAKRRGIASGSVFVTRSGKPIDRFAVWRGMKRLGRLAGVAAAKVFPHNLRHLFARIFYAKIPNLAALADVMGHSDVNTTRIYTASSGAELRRQLDSLRLIL
ncbi:MAG: tyrosine-type recombinase/integrase [Oscillospiraceae bacterium]|jgi:integrase|nr:tyrosine-type recombinase/integrase [Oscillospiraceae bacterium]